MACQLVLGCGTIERARVRVCRESRIVQLGSGGGAWGAGSEKGEGRAARACAYDCDCVRGQCGRARLERAGFTSALTTTVEFWLAAHLLINATQNYYQRAVLSVAQMTRQCEQGDDSAMIHLHPSLVLQNS